MSAYLQSGRSNRWKSGEIRVRFRPEADVGRRPSTSLARRQLRLDLTRCVDVSRRREHRLA